MKLEHKLIRVEEALNGRWLRDNLGCAAKTIPPQRRSGQPAPYEPCADKTRKKGR